MARRFRPFLVSSVWRQTPSSLGMHLVQFVLGERTLRCNPGTLVHPASGRGSSVRSLAQRLVTYARLTVPTAFTADPDDMVAKFVQTVQKLSLLGFDQSTLTDCSDVLPVPADLPNTPHFPAGKTNTDVEQAVS